MENIEDIAEPPFPHKKKKEKEEHNRIAPKEAKEEMDSATSDGLGK